MEQSKRDLEAKRERLIKELEQVNQDIADVDNKLSQLPSALQQLEAEKCWCFLTQSIGTGLLSSSPATAPESMLVFCNVTNEIRKRTDTAVAFTQEYSRVSYKLRNVSTLSMGSGSSKDTHTCVGEIG